MTSDTTTAAAMERQAIRDLIDRAEILAEYPDQASADERYQLSAEAASRLKRWREQYPEATRQAEVNALRCRAARMRIAAEAASPANLDPDWFPDTCAPGRREELLERAAEIGREADDLEA